MSASSHRNGSPSAARSDWLDGRIAYEISPSGANQPVEKGAVLNAQNGEFEGVNRFVKKASHGEIERCSLYSVMEYPMTCCGCFEAIALMLPEVNGIMVVNREYKGMTPSGMTFSTLAGTIGGGAQTPGFAGISKNYILSDRFLQGDGRDRAPGLDAGCTQRRTERPAGEETGGAGTDRFL